MTGPEFNPQRPPDPQYPPGAPYAGPVGPTPKNKSARKWVVGGIAVLLLIVIGVLAWNARRSSPDAAAVGDCVSHGSGDSIKVVDCTSASASFKVVGKVPGKTQTQFNISSATICRPFPGASSAFWKGKVGSTGYILCLAPTK